jgi:membrane-associated phospholipid phosphatase
MRWAIVGVAVASPALAYIMLRGHSVGWPLGEVTMMAGALGVVLIAYNGIIDRPGSGPAEIEVGLDYGYWIALLCAIAISVVGFTRSIESGPRRTRKAPGTV